MRRVRAALRRIAADLADAERSFALVGGFAVSARATPRTTRDVDLVVPVRDDADAEALVFQLQSCGYSLMSAIEQTDTARFATARLRAPSSNVVVDLLFASSGIEAEVAARSEEIEILRRVKLPVARLSDLLALKVLARDDRTRPQDAMDLRALLGEARAGDVEAARAALRMVTERGFSRGRDLDAALERAVTELGPSSGT